MLIRPGLDTDLDAIQSICAHHVCPGTSTLKAGAQAAAEDSVYLAPMAQRRGAAGAPLAELRLARCGAQRTRQRLAEIGDAANQAWIRLQGRLGLTHAGALDEVSWKFGRGLDVVCMQRTWGSGTLSGPMGAA